MIDLISEDSESLFEGELEPVTAGDSVASPVVEVFMGYHAFYARIVHVCCSLWGRQHQPAVEDVQGLVLHCPHVEVIHSNDVEQIQVILQPKSVLQQCTHSHASCGGVLICVTTS